MSDLGTIISALHDSEINGGVSWLYDGVWKVKLGDPHNGFVAEGVVASAEEAAEWLRANAVRRYPQSEFARLYPDPPTTRRPMPSAYHGPPMTLGNAAAAHVRLIVWCLDCRRQVEPDPAEMAARYGAEMSVPDWQARLGCGACGSRRVDMVVTGTERRDG